MLASLLTLERNDDFIWLLAGMPTTALNFPSSFLILSFAAYELSEALKSRF
jgi:hypothetical protein